MNQIKKEIKLDFVVQTLEVINGKWKVPIIVALNILGKCRFTDLQDKIVGIGSKMLSKELKELEMEGIISRKVHHTSPVKIDYELTLYGKTLENIFFEMSEWGSLHQKKLQGKDPDHIIEHFLTFDI